MNFEDLFHINVDSARTLFGETTFHRLHYALDDFNAVIAGRPPIHAAVDPDVPLPADGGTKFYKGDGYKLSVIKSLNGILRGKEYVHGFIYGPIIAFQAEVMTGNFPNIQHLTFYTSEELKKLLACGAYVPRNELESSMENQSTPPRSLAQWAVGFFMGIIAGIFIGAALHAYFPHVFDWLLTP